MTPKEYLMQIQQMEEKLRRRLQQRDELAKIVYGISAVQYNKNKVTGGNIPGDKNKIDQLIDMDAELQQMAIELAQLKKNIIAEIEQLNNTMLEEILYRRYVERQSLREISNHMRYDYGYIRHKHGEALQKFGKESTKKHTKAHSSVV